MYVVLFSLKVISNYMLKQFVDYLYNYITVCFRTGYTEPPFPVKYVIFFMVTEIPQ